VRPFCNSLRWVRIRLRMASPRLPARSADVRPRPSFSDCDPATAGSLNAIFLSPRLSPALPGSARLSPAVVPDPCPRLFSPAVAPGRCPRLPSPDVLPGCSPRPSPRRSAGRSAAPIYRTVRTTVSPTDPLPASGHSGPAPVTPPRPPSRSLALSSAARPYTGRRQQPYAPWAPSLKNRFRLLGMFCNMRWWSTCLDNRAKQSYALVYATSKQARGGRRGSRAGACWKQRAAMSTGPRVGPCARSRDRWRARGGPCAASGRRPNPGRRGRRPGLRADGERELRPHLARIVRKHRPHAGLG
jgi:hypothetical protein